MCSICKDPAHDDLDDSLVDLFGEGPTDTESAAAFAQAALARPASVGTRPEAELHYEPCKKCGGRGRFISYAGRDCGPCFTCKGLGKIGYKTSAETRAKAAEAKQARHNAKVEQFMDEHPAEMLWLANASGRGFRFASDMLVALGKYGDLNDSRMERIRKFMVEDQLRQQAREELAAQAPQIVGAPLDKIEKAFATAMENQIRYPKLRLDTFIFSPASASSANAGAIYVKHASELDRNGEKRYLGKIVEGRFDRRHGCTDDEAQRIIAAAMDPEAASKAYGQREGACSICGRKLTNGESIDRAIGPICATRYGW